MHKITVVLVTLALATGAYAQGAMFAVKLAQKPIATVEDAVTLFMLSTDGKSTGYTKDAETLKQQKLLPKVYDAHAPATMGLVAYMIAKKENLKHSLMFNIFKSQRYAVFACIAAGYVPASAGEHSKLSGVELMEIMGKLGGQE
ncbi:MAG: hypothetical protein ACUVRK_04945 [Spirochaetota bacterium]